MASRKPVKRQDVKKQDVQSRPVDRQDAKREVIKSQVVPPARRLPKQRIITWSVIGVLLVLMLFEWQSRRAYRKTLAELEPITMLGAARMMTKADVDRSVYGWASKRDITVEGQSFLTLHWPSLFRTYTIWLSIGEGGFVKAVQTGAAPDADKPQVPNIAAAPNAAAPPGTANRPPPQPGAITGSANVTIPTPNSAPAADVATFLQSPVGRAFQKCKQIYFQDPAKPGLSDEAIETLQAVAGQIPKLELSTKPLEATWNHLKIFEGGIPFSAFRFSSTLDQPADLGWAFTGEESWLNWHILPVRGRMSGFTKFRKCTFPWFEQPSVPLYDTAFFQTLSGGEIKPAQDYIIYFVTDRILTAEYYPERSGVPPQLFAALRLLPAGSVSQNPPVLEIADLVGARLYSSPGEEILCRNDVPVQMILPAPDANQLILGDRRNVFRWWDLRTKSIAREIQAEEGGDFSCAAISSDGKRLATASAYNSNVLIWDLEKSDSQKPWKTLSIPWSGKSGGAEFHAVAWKLAFLKSPDFLHVDLMATNPQNGERWVEAVQWDVAKDREIRRTGLGHNLMAPTALLQGGEKLVISRNDRDVNNLEQIRWQSEIAFLDSTSGKALTALPLDSLYTAGYFVPSPDEQHVTISLDNRQVILDCKQHKVIQTISTSIWGQTKSESGVLVAAWSPDSRLLAMAYPDRSIRVWDVRQDRLVRSWRGHVESVSSLAFTSDGKWLASSSTDGTVRLWPQESSRLEIVTNSLGMRLVQIPEGEFLLGTPQAFNRLGADLSAEQPQHRVRISHSFYMGMHEVTVKQFRHFVEATGFKTTAETNGVGGSHILDPKSFFQSRPEFTWRSPGFPQADDHPVVQVSWDDAQAFCKWLSNQEQAVYRLPTEAEWEYACRAEQTSVKDQWNMRFRWEMATRPAQVYGNIADQAIRDHYRVFDGAMPHHDGFAFTAPVGSFASNLFGLYDMHGNVFEWCADWYDHLYYRGSPTNDPQGPPNGNVRVQRGGGFSHHPDSCRCGNRDYGEPKQVQSALGFRVVREMPRVGNNSSEE